ncbi:MAG: glutamate racemase [Bdellovibrionales bacterium]|nr:glutamate racemase [Bdellovibrionales bacterium]
MVYTNDLAPIGVFDSGIGGLTVLKGLINLLPFENWVYLGDTARLPYGSKSPETIRNYTLQNLKYLSRYHCKAYVIACNSASAQFPDKSFNGVPVFNVIEPGVKQALSFTDSLKIGIIGTKATINSHIYKNKLLNQNYQGKILEQACPLFVPLVEEGLYEGDVTDLIIHQYLADFKKEKIDSLILGCTHYPLLKKALSKYFDLPIKFISSEFYLSEMLKNQKLTNTSNANSSRNDKPKPQGFTSTIKVLTTDDYKHVKSLIEDILEDLNPSFETVDIRPN